MSSTMRSDDGTTVADVLKSPPLFARESLAGIITCLALIPEVISFSVISGVDPKVALVASIVLGFVMSILGGRPAMVTAAAGSVALVIGPMVKAHGVGYILPTVVLAGAIQIAFGLAGLARMMRYVPRSVMIGFVNSLGILIFFAQVPHVVDKPAMVYALFVLVILIVQLFPRLSTAIPSPLVAIMVATAIVMLGNFQVPNVGGEGSMAPGLPGLTELLVPLSMETLQIVWPTALSVAFVGLLESLLTAKLVDELTETRSHKSRESWALGIANIAAGFYGGIAGCAMIGQTVVNVQLGRARTRVSTMMAVIVMLLMVTGLSHVMAQIPMVALAAVMMIVALKTVNWHSLQPATLKRMPLPETIVMLLTVAITVFTSNLAIGVISGTVFAIVLFARRVAHVTHADRKLVENDTTALYEIHGPLFFGSSNDLVESFSYAKDPKTVIIDFSHSHIWDASTVATLDSIETKYTQHGVEVFFIGLDRRSSELHGRLTGQFG